MVWERTKASLQESLSSNVFGLWIEPLECLEMNDDKIHLSCPDRYFSAYVAQNFLEQIEGKLHEIHGEPLKVVLTGNVTGGVNTKRKSSSRGSQMRLPHIPEGRSKVRSLHPRYTFKEFMVGESNILAQSACKAISSSDDSFGPCLYINSSTGLGKSHLTHAVAHQILADSPLTRLHYLTAQQFASEMVRGITSNNMAEFKQKYHNHCDVLLIEDVHALAGKKKTQEELNELLDTMIKSGKRIVFTANRSPRNLDGVDGEIRSRMSAGLVTSIQSPDLSTRKKIIIQKAIKQGLELGEEYIDYLAQHIKGDVRQIESALISLRAKSQLLGGTIEMGLIHDVVNSVVGLTQILSPHTISEFVSGQFKVTLKEMQSRSRKKNLTFPRQVSMYLSRKYTKESLAEIGKVFNRDHSTVLHSIKVVTELTRRDSSIEAQMDLLSDKVSRL